ncbi:hypothetical protein VHEMI01239 [[Torrubiella] hemipterigena]|uniref:Glycoside hydrolase family 5 domain-containing protein n=1 Tax=[Torrubiella] hemipterigena TaxID=1531966 RepID=A0A0A1T489_9HYPO|nr:hypothetical protein VHEMI01239 [[Torrubiella] hemipterigena]
MQGPLLLVAGLAALPWAYSMKTLAPPANWLYTSELHDTAVKLLNRSDIAGAQVLYSWKSLERGKDQYDFSRIQGDIATAKARGKKLWVQLQDRSFDKSIDPVPRYLKVPYYNNGSAQTCDGNNCTANFVVGGHVAQHWNPRVRERFQALLTAMARELDGSLYGINLAETAIEVDSKKDNYTDAGYFYGELENARHAASVFNKTFVVQYVNFWPDGWANAKGRLDESFDFYAKHGIGAGGPDLIPEAENQLKNSYPFLRRYRTKLPISVVAVQEPDLKATNPHTNAPFTKKEFVDYATNYLGVKIIFWATSSPWLKSNAA